MFRNVYLSPLGRIMSIAMNVLSTFLRPFMVYGYADRRSGAFRKLTRISSTATLTHKDKIAMGDQVWVWHHSIIDGSGGVEIGDGVQIGAWCGIFSHSSHISIRLLGEHYIHHTQDDRAGYIRAPVSIGSYTFLGAKALVMPGAKIGRGCLIAPGAVVSGAIPDFAIAKGDPAKVVGDVRDMDRRFLRGGKHLDTYFAPEALQVINPLQDTPESTGKAL